MNKLNLIKDDRTDESAYSDLMWLRGVERPSYEELPNPVHIVDLFSGCGGLSLGVAEACRSLKLGCVHKWACEIDDEAASIFVKNMRPSSISTSPVEEIFELDLEIDITEIELNLKKKLGDVDILLGGPPCQGHSDLNNHTRRNDPRNQLYSVMARAASVLKPNHVIIENVPGVKHSLDGIVSMTENALIKIGYDVQSLVLNAKDFGVAQSRKRHFTIASKSDLSNISFLIDAMIQEERSIIWAISDIVDEANIEQAPFRTSAVHASINKERIKYLFTHDIYELPDHQRPDCHRLKKHSYKSVYGRLYPDRPAPTITGGFGSTGQGRFVHPLRQRTVTPHEAARIQFFPDWFDFGDAGRRKLQMLIGNAVPPKLGFVLATALITNEKRLDENC